MIYELLGRFVVRFLSSDSKLSYYIAAFTAAMFWSTIGVLGQFLFDHGLDPITVVTFRAFFAFILLALYFLITDPGSLRISPDDVPFFALYGLVGISIFFSLLLYTIEKTNVATAFVLLYTAPAFLTIISRIWFGEPLTRVKVCALFLTFAGCALVVQAYDLSQLHLNMVGIGAGLLCGITYALYSVFGKIAVQKVSRTVTLFYSFLFGSFFLLLLRPPWLLFSLNLPPVGWVYILLIATVPTLFAYSLYIYALDGIEASKAGIIATVEPVAAALLAYVFLDEMLHIPQVLGFILVFVGVTLLPFSEMKKRRSRLPGNQ